VSILKKPAKALTAEDYRKLAKPLGSRVPYPMMGVGYVTDDKGKRTLTRFLGTLDKPLNVTSERDLDDIEGTLIRNMPTPEMLPLFYEVMSAMDPRNERRAMFLKGAPGAGKTFLGELSGKTISPEGAIKVDCTDMNLNELFFETVLDFNANANFYDALNSKIEKYNAAKTQEDRDHIFNPMSIDILEDCLGDAFSREGHKIGIDWAGVKDAHKDEDGKKLDTKESIERAIDGLKKVSTKEGLDKLGGNSLGMATQEGVAWKAYKEGRVLILDEVNRAKRGTFGVLHGWMQFIINEIDDCRVRNPLKEKGDSSKTHLHFKRDEMASGHFVFMTGNLEDDSDEVLEIPEALSSRIVPQHIPKATVQGWQHRICQILTGIPISTLYNAQSDVWDKNPEEFGKKLVEWRMLREERVVPQHQLAMLRRWQDVMQATENLAEFLDSTAKAVDPDSDWQKIGKLSQLLDDISDSFKREASIDFRKITFFINKAFMDKPSVRPPQGPGAPDIEPLIDPMDVTESPEDIRRKMGTHMTYVILDWIISNTYERKKDDLGNQLMQFAAECGIVDPHLIEGMASNRRTFAELLDENPFENKDLEGRLMLVQDLMCNYLRREYPEISNDNDDILPTSVLKRTMEDMLREDVAPEFDAERNVLVFSRDPEILESEPLTEVAMVEGQANKPSLDTMVSQYSLLATLAAPKLREHNLVSLWKQTLADHNGISKGVEGLKDTSLMIADNDEDADLAMTTVTVASDDRTKEVPLHVIWNKHTDRVVVVGEGEIDSSLKRAFNDSRTYYVDRNDAEAVKVLRSGLRFVAGADTKEASRDLKGAFMMRNSLTNGDDWCDKRVSDLLLSRDVVNHKPQYLTESIAEQKPL